MGEIRLIASWGPIETVGQLIEQVNEIGDVDPDTPISCYCENQIVMELTEDKDSGRRSLEIDTP